MRCYRTIALSTFCLAIAGLISMSSATHAADENGKAVTQAMRRFHAALHEMFKGEIGPIKDVWSHADDVTYMGPAGGIQVGWENVLPNWEIQAAKKLGGAVRFENMHVTAGPELGVAICQIVGENMVDGKPQKVSIRATSTFRKENGRWKMIGHHTDLLPFLK